MKPYNTNQILKIQRYVRAAKQCCIIISLCILYDQFDASVEQLQNAYELYKAEVSQYHAWSFGDVKRAYADFKAVAKTFKDAELIVDPGYESCKRDVCNMIVNAELVCFYIMLRLLRTNFGANYKQLSFFIDKYSEFNEIYGEGKQASMQTLAHELYEITGIDILGREGK